VNRQCGRPSLRLLPVDWVGYGLSYMDRINISFASLQNESRFAFQAHRFMDSARDFSLLGYALCEVPSILNAAALRGQSAGWRGSWLRGGLLAAAMLFVRNTVEFNVLAIFAGYGGGRILSRSDLLPDAVVSRAGEARAVSGFISPCR